MNSPPFQISIRKGLEVQDDSLVMRTIRDLHELESVQGIWESWPGRRDSDLDFLCSIIWSRGSDCRPVRTQEAVLQTELIHNLRARSVPHLGTLGEDHFRVLDRRLELGTAVVMEFLY